MGTESIPKLMVSMAVPSIIAQIINILYNIVDRIYIGHIPGVGAAALTGVGITFPIITLISAFSAFVGMGGAPLAAIWLGKGDRKHAERILGSGTCLLVIFTVLLMAVFYGFLRPFLYMFGASDATIGYAMDYMYIYLLGTLFVELALGLNPFIISQGRSRIAMISIVIGAVVNIALDPLFIFVFGWGVKGAAIATVLSQAVSAAWNVKFLMSPKSSLRLSLCHVRPSFRIMWQICSLGISPFIMRSTESLISIVLNRGLQIYGGDLYVGSLTIMQSVLQLFSAPLSGFTQGVQPIISYNFGAGKRDRVMGAFKRMLIICLAASMTLGISAIVGPEIFARMFTDKKELVDLTASVMPVYFFGITIFGIQMACQCAFIALGQAKLSLFAALLRKVILLVPLAIILPKYFGVSGIYYAEPIADIIAVFVTSVLFLTITRKFLRNCGNNDMMGKRKQ